MGLNSKFLSLVSLLFIFAISGCGRKLQTIADLNSITSQGHPQTTYSWQEGAWSSCSATTCGTSGSESRSLQCLSSDNVVVDITLCPAPAPATSQACQAAACPVLNPCTLPWGGSIASGQFVNAFQTSSVPNGQTCQSQTRTCTNGVLSGSFTFQSCTVLAPPAACNLPWGGSIASGQSTTAFQSASVPNGQTCQSQTRTCTNGVLSGSFTAQTCTVLQPAACSLPWGGSIASGQSTTAFQSASVPNGQTCSSQVRTCTNGVLSGSFTAQNCTVQPPPAACTLPWGGTIASGQSTTAFKTASVANGLTCQSQTRTCTNGTLSGTFTFQACTVQPPPAACTLPWGGSLASGQSVTAFQSSTVPNGQTCQSQSRTCTNGSLSGTFTFQGCSVLPPVVTCLNSGNRLATADLIYVNGSTPDAGQAVTDFTNVFGVNRSAGAGAPQAWPNIVNLLVNFTIPKSNYVALQFTVPTTIADQTWGTIGSTATLSNLNATMSISTTCGDFKNIADNCHFVAPMEGAGILWQVANVPSAGTCVLQKGQTYFLNISYYNLDGSTNSRCANASCATSIQNGPSSL